MTKKIHPIFTLILFSLVLGCKNEVNKQESITETPSIQEVDFSGNYVSNDYSKRHEGFDWTAVLIEYEKSKIIVSVRSRADKKKPTCTFDTKAIKVDDNTFKSVVEGKSILFRISNNTLTISPEKPEDEGVLFFYCSGGSSLAGSYTLLQESIDESQLDKTIFSKVLFLQDIGFNISTIEEDKKTILTTQPFGLSIVNRAETTVINGKVINAEIEDLNSDGWPEVLIYTQSTDNLKGDVIAFSVNNGKSMSQVYFPPIAENAEINAGYIGYDEFSLVETSLGRRFPLFENGKKTGQSRQIQYKLKDGEASRFFEIVKSTEY